MRSEYIHYRENISENLNIRHKVTPATEKTTFHLHTHLEIICTLSDNLICRTEHDEIPIPAHALVLLNSMSLHYIDYRRNSGLCDRYVLHFEPDLARSLNTPEVNLLDCFMRKQEPVIVLTPPQDVLQPVADVLARMEETFLKISSPCAADRPMDRAMNQLALKLDLGQLLLLVNRISQEVNGAPGTPSYQAHSHLMTEICQYIDTRYSEPLSIDSIAREFLMSKTQLYNISREVLQMSLSDYISHVRLTQAKSLLINTDYSVEIIGQMTGYSSISSFSRVFKEKAGISPLQYRKRQSGGI